MNLDYRAEIRGDVIVFPGVDWSNKAPLTVAAMGHDLIAVRHPGGSCWGGVGMPRMAVRAHFMVFHILQRNGDRLTLGRVLDVPLRASK